MSYSFTVRKPTKAEAKAEVAAQFSEVVNSQPIHERERAAALALADTFVDLLADDETKDVTVHVSGSLSWQGSLEGMQIEAVPLTSANLNVNAYHQERQA